MTPTPTPSRPRTDGRSVPRPAAASETARTITLGELVAVLHDLSDDPEQIAAVIRHLSQNTRSRRIAKGSQEADPPLAAPAPTGSRIYNRGRDSSGTRGA